MIMPYAGKTDSTMTRRNQKIADGIEKIIQDAPSIKPHPIEVSKK